MIISEAIIHRFEKKSGSNEVKKHLRSTLSPNNELMKTLGEDLLGIYQKNYDSSGTLDSGPAYPFSALLGDYNSQVSGLVEFSRNSCDIIERHLKASMFATGGYVFFIRFQSQGDEWLLIAILKLRNHAGINERTLELESTISFDISHLHEAARINLGKWSRSQQPYLTFIKRRGGEDVTKYFREALGCSDYIDSRHNTKELIKAISSYCDENSIGADKKAEYRKIAHEYFEEVSDSLDKAVNLKSLSSRLNNSSPESFYNHIKDNDLPVTDGFTPSRTIFGQLKRISKRLGSISVGFDVQDVTENKVDYDEFNDIFIIRSEPKLRAAVREAKGLSPIDASDMLDEPNKAIGSGGSKSDKR